jgi:hypothetical protein
VKTPAAPQIVAALTGPAAAPVVPIMAAVRRPVIPTAATFRCFDSLILRFKEVDLPS